MFRLMLWIDIAAEMDEIGRVRISRRLGRERIQYAAQLVAHCVDALLFRPGALLVEVVEDVLAALGGFRAISSTESAAPTSRGEASVAGAASAASGVRFSAGRFGDLSCLRIVRRQLHAGDRLNLGFIQPAEAADAQRGAALGLGDGLHHGVGARLAFQHGRKRHRAEVFVRAAVRRGCLDVNRQNVIGDVT